MKKALTILFVTLSILIILDSLNAGHALFMFLLAGVIPGTDMTISATSMLELFTLLIGFTLSRLTIALLRFVESGHEKTASPSKSRTRISAAQA